MMLKTLVKKTTLAHRIIFHFAKQVDAKTTKTIALSINVFIFRQKKG